MNGFAFVCLVVGLVFAQLFVGSNGQSAPMGSCSSGAKCCGVDYSSTKVHECPDGWTAYKNLKCVKIYTQAKTFDDAQAACQVEGANLPSIHSDDEFGFLKAAIVRDVPEATLANNAFFIGLTRKSDAWIWTDLSPLDYQNWYPGHPNANGDCGRIASFPGTMKREPTNYMKWISDPCKIPPRYYICQKPLVPVERVKYIQI